MFTPGFDLLTNVLFLVLVLISFICVGAVFVTQKIQKDTNGENDVHVFVKND